MSVLPNLIYKFSASIFKTPACYFVDMNEMIPKFMQRQNTQNSQDNIKGEEQSQAATTWL